MNPKSVPMPKACNLFFIVSLVLFIILSAAGCRKNIHEVSAVQSGGAVNNADAAATPNIILILGDDVGYEVPACYGGQSYSTPFIDSIASAGRRFTNCYSAPSCSPSRFMLLSGKYNFRNYRKWGQMPITTKTIGNMFSDAGYSTCYAGKWQLDGGDNSIRTFGWQKYAVWLPFKLQDEGLEGSRYKSSKIYQDGGYMPQSYSYNKYSEDLFTDYILHFTDSMKNQSKP
ncbi:MAG TPA: sulfatase-like hydrolase/transferase, partial [Chitinophagaceae bacterium]|nr:sulfatase-like hydrolase/transferase [Chitinophagaceae bacterium]